MWFRLQNKQRHLKNQDTAEQETTHRTISTYQDANISGQNIINGAMNAVSSN